MITTRERVAAAVERALDGACYGSIERAKEAAAAELCLPLEAVHQALQPLGHCCEMGENLGVGVCDDCAAWQDGLLDAWGLGIPEGSAPEVLKPEVDGGRSARCPSNPRP